MKQGRITDHQSEGHKRAAPEREGPCVIRNALGDRRAIDQLLDTLVQGLARRVATRIIKDGDTT